MGDHDGAMDAFTQALRHNRSSIPALNSISCILRTREQFPKAVDYLLEITRLDPNNGEVWGSLGMCSQSYPVVSANTYRALLPHDGRSAKCL